MNTSALIGCQHKQKPPESRLYTFICIFVHIKQKLSISINNFQCCCEKYSLMETRLLGQMILTDYSKKLCIHYSLNYLEMAYWHVIF